jgi:glutamate racemase
MNGVMINRPIAVLDTGVGGLSVVKALRNMAPDEVIHYFADTAYLPYGLKSPEFIKFLGLRAARALVKHVRPKILVIACHTISVWCLKELEDELKIPVVAMLEPSINGLKKLIYSHAYARVAIISTKATLSSGAYSKAWNFIDPTHKSTLIEHACSPLVSLIEEGFAEKKELHMIIDSLLPQAIKEANALLLGCTHFSALTPVLTTILRPGAHIIDAAYLVAAAVIEKLKEDNILAQNSQGFIKGYVSDNPERFLDIAKLFINEPLSIEVMRT